MSESMPDYPVSHTGYTVEMNVPEDRRDSQVEIEVAKQSELIPYLHLLISDLEQRLNRVLIQLPEERVNIVSEPRELLVPLADTIRLNNDKLEDIQSRLVSIKDRLEV